MTRAEALAELTRPVDWRAVIAAQPPYAEPTNADAAWCHVCWREVAPGAGHLEYAVSFGHLEQIVTCGECWSSTCHHDWGV